MRKLILCALLVFTAAIFSFNANAEVAINEPAPDFSLVDSNGKTHSLADYKGKYVVLEWVNYQCPFVVKHYRSGNMQNLQKTYTAKDVVWFSINSSAKDKQGYYPSNEINQIMANSDAKPTAYLIDADGVVGRQYGAQTTPHMFVINPDGKLIYQGAIDSIPSFDEKDIAAATNYVSQALNQSMEGKEISDPATKAYGCSVKY